MFQSLGESSNINHIYCLKSQLNDAVILNLKNSFDTSFNEFKTEDISDSILIPSNINLEVLGNCLIPAGLLLPSEQKINLLPADIRETAAKKRTMKMQLIVFSSVMLCLIVACSTFLWINYQNSASNRKIAALVAANKHEILELERANKQLEIVSRFKVNNTLPLDILKEMSSNLPESVYIRQLNYDYSEGTLALRARAGSYAVASKVLAQLGKSKYFFQVTDKGSYTVKIGDKDLVDFEVVCAIKK
jgi:Tfp pilus assembly protein PilN